MFTGIIEELGRVKFVGTDEIEISALKVLKDTKLGDSISINGVCETVTEITSDNFRAKISPETFSVTTLGTLQSGDYVNLERALTLSSRLGGHIVSGHVDCKGTLTGIVHSAEFYELCFEIPKECAKYIVYKGSVTINGISLTVARVKNNSFNIAVIPHTFNNTNLKYLKIGDKVNIETDILGKYVEKMLSAADNKENHISMEFLAENGFV